MQNALFVIWITIWGSKYAGFLRVFKISNKSIHRVFSTIPATPGCDDYLTGRFQVHPEPYL